MNKRRALATAVGVGAVAGVVALNASRTRQARHEPLAHLDGGDGSKVETSDGAVLQVHTAGAGDRTVVLSHCWTGDMRIWEPVAAALVADGYRVIRYDQRGHGGSTLGADPCTIERLGLDLLEVLEAVDATDVVLAGHSMGGMAAQAFVIEHPDAAQARVRALVLVATASGGLGGAPLHRFAPRVIGTHLADRALSARGGHAFMRSALGKHASPEAVKLTRDTFVATPPDVRLAHFHAMGAMDLVESRRAISMPTTVVVGTRDTLTPPVHARGIAEAVAGARLVVVPGAGHMLPLEATALVTQLIEEAAS